MIKGNKVFFYLLKGKDKKVKRKYGKDKKDKENTKKGERYKENTEKIKKYKENTEKGGKLESKQDNVLSALRPIRTGDRWLSRSQV